MRNPELYEACSKYGNDARFVANVVYLHHRNPHAKLHGLLSLLENDATVRTANFDIDVLVVNGERMAWDDLEKQ